METENKELLKALSIFQKDCPGLALNSKVNVKTKTGGQYSFKYADLPYIMETIQPTLSANDLVLSFDFPENSIKLTIYHVSGQFISSQLPIKLTNSPQENGSLITYYRRYLITSLLNITADKDDDANTFEQQERKVDTKKEVKTPTITDKQFDATSNCTDPVKIQNAIDRFIMTDAQKKDLTQLIVDIEVNQVEN